jgi:hypothetical protein
MGGAGRYGLALLILVGCDHDSPAQSRQRGPDLATIGERVRVGGGETQLGFANGTLRSTVTLRGYQISKLPVTQGQLAACQIAGVCEQNVDNCEAEQETPASEAPALCMGPAIARQYCGWVGGRLPILSEWLTAARGNDIRRFAWGNDQPNCDQHPLGGSKAAITNARDAAPLRGAQGSIKVGPSASNSEPSGEQLSTVKPPGEIPPPVPCQETPSALSFLVGKHAASASPHGMQDVLLLPSELIAQDTEALLPACQVGDCLVSGLVPAAIDSARPFDEVRHFEGAEVGWSTVPPDNAHAVRCLWEVTP